MSAFGTKRTSRPCRSMSAFGGKADILAADASAIDVKSLSCHEGCIVAGKKGDRANQIIRHFGPLNRLHSGRKRELVFHAGEPPAWIACKGAWRSREAG